jgi:hypothetical protein
MPDSTTRDRINGRFSVDTSEFETYTANPKTCKKCTTPIPFEKRKNDFCSHSCATAYNNKGICRIRLTHTCKKCGKPTHWKYVFCSTECEDSYTNEEFIRKVCEKINRGDPVAHTTIRNYLMKTRERVCAQCQNVAWNGLPIPLEVHHKDGRYKNNKEQNLELLCPNCHSQTDNYRMKNKGNGRDNRVARVGKKEQSPV